MQRRTVAGFYALSIVVTGVLLALSPPATIAAGEGAVALAMWITFGIAIAIDRTGRKAPTSA